ncbi:hypothetical protein RND81_01G071700 [Saponaria officinalis]|uniref:Uncharacterized protein n=1 Tax=Saponaria officinalis TaxID=3572 RepID=A0AAW1ND41_SAPOF
MAADKDITSSTFEAVSVRLTNCGRPSGNGDIVKERLRIYETPRNLCSTIRLTKTMIIDQYMSMYKRVMEQLIRGIHINGEFFLSIVGPNLSLHLIFSLLKNTYINGEKNFSIHKTQCIKKTIKLIKKMEKGEKWRMENSILMENFLFSIMMEICFIDL